MPRFSPVDFAALAREIAMDIFPLAQILELHRLDDAEWLRISENTRFQSMLEAWCASGTAPPTPGSGCASRRQPGWRACWKPISTKSPTQDIPLTQRVEAGKFLARLGELDGNISGELGEKFSITLNIGDRQNRGRQHGR